MYILQPLKSWQLDFHGSPTPTPTPPHTLNWMKWLHKLITQTKGSYRLGFCLEDNRPWLPCTSILASFFSWKKNLPWPSCVAVCGFSCHTDQVLWRQWSRSRVIGTIFVNRCGISLQLVGVNTSPLRPLSWRCELPRRETQCERSWKGCSETRDISTFSHPVWPSSCLLSFDAQPRWSQFCFNHCFAIDTTSPGSCLYPRTQGAKPHRRQRCWANSASFDIFSKMLETESFAQAWVKTTG